MSPFDAGGGNGFAYCSGDSINNTDASGHGPLLDFIFIFAGFVGRNVRRASEEMEVAGQAMNRVEGMMDLEVGRNVVSAVATDGSSFTPGDALNAQKGFFEDFLRQQDILVDGWQSNNKFSAFYNSDSRKLKGTIKLVLNKEGGFTARIKLTKRRAYRLSWGEVRVLYLGDQARRWLNIILIPLCIKPLSIILNVRCEAVFCMPYQIMPRPLNSLDHADKVRALPLKI
ncbi:hypothetical protein LCD46_09440 [Enterobacter ludwigii]|uniref:hypothetical protein n=1 Tax=unclassified Enterobacter TaxID=2608935 RepID=UPI001ABEAE6F|nr:hypothetical protein [Enterobacter ludwigii]UOY72508.1 hypothetical protein LCD46_09440 [Enterobacter ludwigii]